MTHLIASLLACGMPHLVPTTLARLHVESGAVEPAAGGGLLVRDPSTRAIVPGTDGKHLRVAFTYLGPTESTAPLASGELRRQIGLKLIAQDPCNVVYVTWRIPDGIYVQVKANPGQSRFAECRDHGYQSVRADTRRPAPTIQIGERHTLSAAIEGQHLIIHADEVAVWEGTLPREVSAFDGPAGIRTDNAQFAITLWTSPST